MAGRIWLAMLFVVGGCGKGAPGTASDGGPGGGGASGAAGSPGGSSGQGGAGGATDQGTAGASGSGGNAGAGVVAGTGGRAGTGGAAGTGGRAGSGGAAGTGGRGGSGGGTGGGGPYPEAPGLCKAGWCWSNPVLQGNALTSMCGRSASDVWVSGHGATLLHWDGTRWTSVPTGLVAGTAGDLHDIWCGPGGSVWVVGNDAIVRVQGGVASANLVPAGSDVYGWRSVGGTAEDDVWIGGRFDTILRWNGSELVQMHRAPSTARDSDVLDIVARARNDVWFGTSWTSFHYDGATITEQPLTPTLEGPQNLWWAPGDDLLASDYDGIYRWSDQAPASWQKVSATFTRRQDSTAGGNMFGLSSRDLWWADGGGDLLSHWDGTSWFYFSTPRLWTCGYVAPTGEVFAAGSALGRVAATPARVQDRTLEIAGRGRGLPSFTGIWSSPAGVVHAVPGPYRLTADGWTLVSPTGQAAYTAIWGSGENDVWAVGSYGSIGHFDGQSWTAVDAGIPQMDAYTLFAVGGTGPSDVWAVGRNGMIGHYDGSAWRFGLQATLNNLYGVWAISPDDVWAVGANGTRIHYANRAWTGLQAVTSRDHRAVWAAAANDVWVTDTRDVWHWNGSTWTSMSISFMGPPRFDAVHGRASNDVWVAGQYGTLLHWDGARWSDGSSPTSGHLSALWVGSAGDVWLAGEGGTILRRR